MNENRPHLDAELHLGTACQRMKTLIERVGPCSLRFEPDSFSVLVRSVVAQQISTKAAASISSRLRELCGRKGIKPNTLDALTDEQLQSCGLSTSKRKTIRGLVECAKQNPRYFSSLAKLDDEKISARLLPLHGIGPWTVQMFLIFGLGRMDILPIGDLGFRIGVKELFELDEVPATDEIHRLTEVWKPYRTIATWYLWRSRDGEASLD